MSRTPSGHFSIEAATALLGPIDFLVEEGFLRGRVCVYDNAHAALLLKGKGIEGSRFEPLRGQNFPVERYDTVLSFYRPESFFDPAKNDIVMDVSALLAPGGRAYFIMEHDRENFARRLALKGEDLHRYNREAMLFREIWNTGTAEIYEYIPYTEIYQGNEKASPFFSIDEPRGLITESAAAFAILDKYPVSPGHTLIIPKRVTADYFDLSWPEQEACWKMVAKVKAILDASFKPDGYNVGINVSEAAGQTVPHVHIHVIPRYTGDVEEPRGGVRGVVPGRRSY